MGRDLRPFRQIVGRATVELRSRLSVAELGKPVSRFVIDAGVEQARGILADTQVLRVADRAAGQFEAWLDEPPKQLPAATRLADAEPFERT